MDSGFLSILHSSKYPEFFLAFSPLSYYNKKTISFYNSIILFSHLGGISMNNSSFFGALTSALSAHLEPGTKIVHETILKNNGVRLESMLILDESLPYAPVIYLAPLYDHYKAGSSMEEICHFALAMIHRELPFSPDSLIELQKPQAIKDRIAYRLVSRTENGELLKDIPWVPFLNMAVIFFLQLDSTADTQITTLIHKRLAALWDFSTNELFRLAKKNTPLLFPISLAPLRSLIADSLEETEPEPDRSALLPPIHVLTNRQGIYGASCLLYENVIKDFAEQMASDVIILPSSIHEVLLIPDSHVFDYESLRQMVQAINAAEVPKEDILSDEIYLYIRCSHSFKTWPSPSLNDMPSPDETTNP